MNITTETINLYERNRSKPLTRSLLKRLGFFIFPENLAGFGLPKGGSRQRQPIFLGGRPQGLLTGFYHAATARDGRYRLFRLDEMRVYAYQDEKAAWKALQGHVRALLRQVGLRS